MRKVFILSTGVALLALSVISCNKDENTTKSTKDYSDVVADEIAASSSNLSIEVTGTSNSYNEYETSEIKSGTTNVDTIFEKKKTLSMISNPLAPYAYSFTYTVDFGVVASNGVLDNFFFNSGGSGNYTGIIVDAEITESSSWILTGLSPTSKNFVLNGTGVINSNSINKIKEDTIVSTSNIKFQDVTYNKVTDSLSSGTLNWDISGTVNGESFIYSAVLTFTSGTEASLSLNSNKYYINISTGTVTKKE